MKTLGELLTAIDDASPTKVRECLKRECLKLIATTCTTNPKETLTNDTPLDPDMDLGAEAIGEIANALIRFSFWPSAERKG